MATLLLSCKSSQDEPDTPYTDALVTDQRLVTDTTSAYQTTQGATDILTSIVTALTPSPQGILHLIPVHFMQEATISLPLMLKYFTKQPPRTNEQYTVLPVNRPTLEIFMLMTANLCNCELSR